jgi:hypothetical protein
MPWANEKKKARRRARQSERDMQWITPETARELIASIQKNIWHQKRPPLSVAEALSTDLGYELPEPDLRAFVALGGMLAARDWDFLGECSGPDVLTWLYVPSDAGPEFQDRGLEPITAIAATLDRSMPTDTVADCEVELFLVGTPAGECRLTGLAGLKAQLGVIEAHRPGDPILVSFPVGRARVPSA